MMFFSDDPISDAERYTSERCKSEHFPICSDCGCTIDFDDHYYNVEGDILCDDCLDERYKKDVNDYGC